MNVTRTFLTRTAWSGVWGGKKFDRLIVCCILLLGVRAFAGTSAKVSAELQTSNSQPVDVIVQYKTTPVTKHFNNASKHGAKLKTQFTLSNGAVYSLTASQASQLANDDSDIAYITPDRPVKATWGGGIDYSSQFEAVNADIAQGYGYDGTGVTVAVIDSGIGSHSDLSSRLRSGFHGAGNRRPVWSRNPRGRDHRWQRLPFRQRLFQLHDHVHGHRP